MPRFSYEAIDARGKAVKGYVPGNSLTEAASGLRQGGLVITALKEYDGQSQTEREVKGFSAKDLLGMIQKVKQADIVLLLRQLGALINAGVSIVNSISILENQSKNYRIKNILTKIREDVEAGNSLSEAMEAYPRIFPKMVTSILKTGETSGLMDQAIERVTDYWDEKLALRQQMITSLMYPVIILIVSVAIVFFLIAYVLPNMIPLMESMGGEMPWSAKLLLSIADKTSENLANIGIGLVVLIVVIIAAYRISVARYFIDKYKIHIPVIGEILQYSVIVSFARTLSMLINSGVSIVEAISSTRNTINNAAVKRIMDDMLEKVNYGEALSDPLLKYGNFFPLMVGNMIKVGEETGGIDASLEMVAGIYSKLLEVKIKRMISMIEPVMLIVLGGIIAFIAMTVISTILSSYSI